jgi:hypothetical protein
MNGPGPKEAGLYWLKPASYMIEYKELFKVFPFLSVVFRKIIPN